MSGIKRKNRRGRISRTTRAQIRAMAKTKSVQEVMDYFEIANSSYYRIVNGKYLEEDDLDEDELYLNGTMGDIIVIDDESAEESDTGEHTGRLEDKFLEAEADDKSNVQQEQLRRSTRERKRVKYEPESDDNEPPVIPPPRRVTVIAKNPLKGSTQQSASTSSSVSSSKSQAPISSASTSAASSSASEMDPAVQEFFKGLGLKGLNHQLPILCKFGFRTTEDLDFHCMSVKDEGDEHLAELEGRLTAKGINGTEWMAISKGLKRRALSMN